MNLKTAAMINTFIDTTHPEQEAEKHLQRLVNNIMACGCYSLYSEDYPADDITYIASHTCDNKVCHICNWHRQKRVRRTYMKWFKENQSLVEFSKAGKNKVTTRTQYETKYMIHPKISDIKYDLFSLTLTVPHYSAIGFRGEEMYYKQIATAFNYMRKEAYWVNNVFGGEYGTETVGKPDDLHIHIHALLLVRQYEQNRNHLHKFIMQKWNRLTIDENSDRETIDDETAEAIMKGNKLFTIQKVKELNPKGATFINLESPYYKQYGKKFHVRDLNSKNMIFAVMEAISYHFKPQAIRKEGKDEGEIDIPLLSRILPAIYNNRALYAKFGCLQGEKSLNINYSDPEALKRELQDVLEMDIDQDTGELRSYRNFFVCNPAYIFHAPEENFRIVLSDKAKKMSHHLTNATGTGQALDIMTNMALAKFKKNNSSNN
jgi:hypothetical protein